MRVFPIFSLMMPVNLIQYRRTVGMFNNRRFASSSLNYSYFSKKYHNYDTFTLAVGSHVGSLFDTSDVLSFNQCIIQLEIHISISSRPCWYLQFFKKDPIFKYDWYLPSPHLAQSNYYQAKW